MKRNNSLAILGSLLRHLVMVFPLLVQDFGYVYDAHVTPSGAVVFLGSGYGELVIDEAGYQRDNITAAFDENGQKLFAKRLEIWDAPPTYRPEFIGSKTFSDDLLRIRTSFHSLPEDKPGATIFAANIFTLQLDGTQIHRVDVPQYPSIHYKDTHLGPDGSIWAWQAPAPTYQYSKDGNINHTLDIEKPENLDLAITRGFEFDGRSARNGLCQNDKHSAEDDARYIFAKRGYSKHG